MSTRAAIYARLSRNKDGSTSIARQVSDCRERFEKGWTEVGVYEDDDFSAYDTTVTRPAWERMLTDIADGRVELVVALALDRLGRQPSDIERLLKLGVRFVTVRDRLDSESASHEFQIRVMSAVAKMESDTISARILSKHEELRQEGQWSGGRRAFGLSEDWSELIPDEAALIQEAAERVIDGGGVTGIASDWNKRGIQTRSGKRWDPSSVKRMLLSPRMVGRRRIGGELSPVGMPAVLDEDTWQRVAVVLTNPERRHSDGNRVKHLLAGFLYCGRCGAKLHTHTKVQTARKVYSRRYQCMSLRGGCGTVSVSAEPTERYVQRVCSEYLGSTEFKQFTAERQAQHAKLLEDADALRVELAANKARLAPLLNLYAAGELTLAEWKAARVGLVEKITTTEDSLRRAEAQGDVSWYSAEGLPGLVWQMADTGTRRQLIASIVEKVVIQPATGRGRRFDTSRIEVVTKVPDGIHPGDLVRVDWLAG